MSEYVSTWVAGNIDLLTTAEGGLRRSWEAPTPSFFHIFDGIQLGADMYTANDAPLNPGESPRSIHLRFWAPIARELALAGASFVLVYGDRVIGSGRITDTLDGPPMAPPPGWPGYDQVQ